MRGAQQGGHGLQETHCDAWHLGVPLANTSQLLAQGLLQGQGEGAWTGALPPWVGAQWEDLKAEGVGSAEALYPWLPCIPLLKSSRLGLICMTKGPGVCAEEWQGTLTPQELL